MQFRPHISLEVADLDAAVQFYSTMFAVGPTKHYADYANFRLEDPALHLALVSSPGRDPHRLQNEHFGIELFDDSLLEAWRIRAQSAGLPLRTEEQVTCCYAVADKFWLQDPDGREWEFWVRHDEADQMHAEEVSCCAPPEPEQSACCNPNPTAEAFCCN